MDNFRQWLARKLLNAASRLLVSRRAYNGQMGWKFENDWRQPKSERDQSAPKGWSHGTK